MQSIQQAVENIIEKDGFLHFGISNGVLNLSKTARFIRPLVEARAKKGVSVPAITMALSRLKVSKRRKNAELKAVKLSSMNVTKNLTEITFERTAENATALQHVENELRRSGKYAVITFGTSELTALVDESGLVHVKAAVPGKLKAVIPDLVAIGASFDEKYVTHVGMVYTLIQQLTFQNVNVVEFSSTYTEFVFYLKKEDLKVAFDTLYEQFM